MASKRRNMFHKNKTQETTENGHTITKGWQIAPTVFRRLLRLGLLEHVSAIPSLSRDLLRQKMASKRRNMFQKNKTQETTENAHTNFRRLRDICDPPTLRMAFKSQITFEKNKKVGDGGNRVLSLVIMGDKVRNKYTMVKKSNQFLPKSVIFSLEISGQEPTADVRYHALTSFISEFFGPNRFQLIVIFGGAVWDVVHDTIPRQ
ncbi:hypothetical protein AAG570_009786 [Ranatra chinensis]|uniref:Uncharacterized protein n=1 Tax=Ranatra chinensis TaxID=642074 RepID=A0ABD0YQ46_9HEMI